MESLKDKSLIVYAAQNRIMSRDDGTVLGSGELPQ